MTRHNTTAFGTVRISPDGEHLAWYRPESDDDGRPWLVVTDDPAAASEEYGWLPESAVAGWTELESPAITRADDALVGEVIAVVDPVPAGLPERVRRAADAAGGGAS